MKSKRKNWKNLALFAGAASLKAAFIFGLAACGSDPKAPAPAASPAASTAPESRPVTPPPADRAPVPVNPSECAQVHSHDDTQRVSFTAEALSEAEIQRYRDNQATEMPYIATMRDGRGTLYRHALPVRNLTDAPRLEGTTPYVTNQQTMMKFVLRNLPARNTVESVHRANLSLYVHKVSREEYTSSELLCFAESRACSGEVFTARNYLHNVNRSYFRNGSGPANRFFAEQLLGEKKDARVGGHDIYAGQLDMTLESLLTGTGIEPLDLIYGGADPAQPLAERTIIVVVADDSYVVPNDEFGLPKGPQLVLELRSSGWAAVMPAEPTPRDPR